MYIGTYILFDAEISYPIIVNHKNEAFMFLLLQYIIDYKIKYFMCFNETLQQIYYLMIGFISFNL